MLVWRVSVTGCSPVSESRFGECSDVIRAVWGDNLLYFTLGSSLVEGSELVWRVFGGSEGYSGR